MGLICLSFHHIKTGYCNFQKVRFEDPKEFYLATNGERFLLQTGTRVEVYAHANSADALLDVFTSKSGLERKEIKDFFSVYSGRDAALHLLRMTGSIESRVLGETYIPLAVKSALAHAKEMGGIGPKITALANTAVRVGERARAETRIGGEESVANITVESIMSEKAAIKGGRAVLLGAGRAGIRAAGALKARGFDVTTINRNYELAKIAAKEAEIAPAKYEELEEKIAGANVLVCATLASHYRVLPEMISERKHPLIIVDVSPFRNVSPDVAGVPGVILKNGKIEDAVLQNRKSAKEAVPGVERIIEEELSKIDEGFL